MFQMRRIALPVLITCLLRSGLILGQPRSPLQVLSSNPRYFTDGSGRAVLLAGSHTWSSIFDQGPNYPPPPFNTTQFLDFLQSYGQNFTRTFVWEQTRWGTWSTDNNYWFYPGPPWMRTGPGNADDGRPKFNLDSLNQSYFSWIRAKVDSFAGRGIYCSVQFFNGWSVKSRLGIGNPWPGHPFKSTNNVNGVNGDPNNDASGEETQANNPVYWPYQERYIKRLIDALNDCNNIIWEISNETSYNGSDQWERRIIDTIHAYERRKPKQHPVGFTGDWYPPILNPALFASNADWISPGGGSNGDIWKDSPPDSGGRKVVFNDTDHLWGTGGDAVWVWKSFTRGCNVLYMDGYDGKAYAAGHPWSQADSANPTVVQLRKNMGYILDYSRRVNLASMRPRADLSSTLFCLANPTGNPAEYVVLTPSGSFNVDLSNTPGQLNVEWFNLATGGKSSGGSVAGGAIRPFTPPISGPAVLYLSGGASSVDRDGTLPVTMELIRSYPNPFNGETTIMYSLSARSSISLTVMTLLGENVRILVAGEQGAGKFQAKWDGRNDAGHAIASGIYLLRLQTKDKTLVQKLVMVK